MLLNDVQSALLLVADYKESVAFFGLQMTFAEYCAQQQESAINFYFSNKHLFEKH